MTKLTRRGALTLLGASGLPLPALAQSGDPINIGVMLPLSGGSAIAGREVIQGVQLAFEEGSKDGALGRKLEMITEDDEGSPTKGVTAVRKLIERDRVPVVVGTYVSGVALAATRIAREQNIPMVSAGSTAVTVTDDNTPGNPWFFRGFPGSDLQGQFSGEDIVRTLQKRRVAIIHDNSNYGTTLADQINRVVTESGGTVISRESYNAGEQDFSPLLTRLRSQRPDAVYIGGLVSDGANIVRQAADVGLRTQFVGSGSMMTDSFITLTGAASEGFAVSSMFEPEGPNPVGNEFAARFRARFGGVNPSVHQALGFDAMTIALAALKRAGKPDGTAIQAVLKQGMPDVKLVLGPPGTVAVFDAKGSINFRIGMAQVRNGKRAFVDPPRQQ